MKLRTANLNDIDFIQSLEAREEFGTLILRWSRDEHTQNLHSLDKRYLMIENNLGAKIGYVILSGIQSFNQSIELTRIVIAEPERGYGRSALKLVIKQVFEEYKSHRLWLDVFDYNQRARHVYQLVGFKEEGILREAVK